MPTISTKSSFVFFLLGLACPPSFAANSTAQLSTGASQHIEIGKWNEVIFARRSSSARALALGRSLRKRLSAAEEIIAVSTGTFPLGNGAGATLIARTPSPAASGTGYCGAGHEDYLVLVKISGNTIKLMDETVIQSCLKGISLVSDRGDDPRDAVAYAPPPLLAKFNLMTPPSYQIKGMRALLVGERIVIESDE